MTKLFAALLLALALVLPGTAREITDKPGIETAINLKLLAMLQPDLTIDTIVARK